MEGRNFEKIKIGEGDLLNSEKTKNRIEKLSEEYSLPINELTDESVLISGLAERTFQKFLSNKTKSKIKEIKKIYGLEKFNLFSEVKNIVFITEEKYKKISSPEFIKQIENLSDSIGYDKRDIIQYFCRTNFRDVELPLIKNLSERKIVFSQDVKKAKLDPGLFFQSISRKPSLWGRERGGVGIVSITDYITISSPRRLPFKGWPYVAAERIDRKEIDSEERLDRIFEFQEGINGELGLVEAKKRIDYVKEHLPIFLKNRIDNLFNAIKQWKNEVKDIEQKYDRLQITNGAYVRFDDKLDAGKSFQGKLSFSEREYKNLYDYLDRGFKTPSELSNFIGKGIEELYDFMSKRKEEYTREVRNLEYLMSHQKELSPEEIKTLEEKSRNILNPFEIMESIHNTSRGFYFSKPALHGGARGWDVARFWDPRSFALRDSVFYRVEKDGKENFINVKEYHLRVVGDDLKVRLSSFSEKPDPKKLGEQGLSVEIERNGETRFLNKKETEKFLKELKEYTLITLYFKNSPSLKAEKENEATRASP